MYVILKTDIYSCKPVMYFTDFDKAKRIIFHLAKNSRYIFALIALNLSASNYPEYKQGVNFINYEGEMYNDICTCLLTGDYKMSFKIRR